MNKPNWILAIVVAVGLLTQSAQASVLIPQGDYTATASSEYGIHWNAAKAIDGNGTTDWVATGSPPENLKIDLGAEYLVDKVRYKSRDCGIDMTKDYKFWVTNTNFTLDGSDLTNAPASLGAATASGQFPQTGNLWVDITFTATTGRYVYFQGDTSWSSNNTSASEIEVYEVPEPASAMLLLTGGVLAVCRRRKR